MIAPDPFVELGIPADENVRTIAPISPTDSVSRKTCEDLARTFDPSMNRLARFAAAQNKIRTSAPAALRVEAAYNELISNNS